MLLFHALSGTHHAAGFTDQVDGTDDRWTAELHAGWWDDFIGPGRALDTDRFHVICVNLLGGCYGSTGPASIDPKTGTTLRRDLSRKSASTTSSARRYCCSINSAFEKLHAVIGPSVGGLCALTFANLFPRTRAVCGAHCQRLQHHRAQPA